MSDHAGLNWRPSASRLAIEKRAKLLADIRLFFTQRKVLEVETPILSEAGNTDPSMMGMRIDSTSPSYLRTSPEYPMKRLLAAGLTDIYEMGKVFRAEEIGNWHNPEFTLLEWYRLGLSYLELADEVVALVRHCGHSRMEGWEVRRYAYRELFRAHTGLDPGNADASEWQTLAQELGIRAGQLDAQQWQDLVLTHIIQPAFDPESFTIIYDYPPEQAALARLRQGESIVAERFEVYLGGAELANGYQELADASEQLQRFESEQRLLRIRGEEIPPLDQNLIAALQHGLPECSGVALGVDRLLMQLMELDSISAVIAFPQERA